MISYYIMLIFTLSVFSFLPQIIAEPITDPEVLKQYKITYENAIKEKHSPKKQLDNNIITTDVVCFNNKVPILKLTAEKSIACVDSTTATKLVQRNWGLIHKLYPHEGTAGVECTNHWIIYHDVNMPSNGVLIKTLRETTSSFANDFVVWSPIKIEKTTIDSTVLYSRGAFSSEEVSLIKNGFLNIDNIFKIEHKPGMCL